MRLILPDPNQRSLKRCVGEPMFDTLLAVGNTLPKVAVPATSKDFVVELYVKFELPVKFPLVLNCTCVFEPPAPPVKVLATMLVIVSVLVAELNVKLGSPLKFPLALYCTVLATPPGNQLPLTLPVIKIPPAVLPSL